MKNEQSTTKINKKKIQFEWLILTILFFEIKKSEFKMEIPFIRKENNKEFENTQSTPDLDLGKIIVFSIDESTPHFYRFEFLNDVKLLCKVSINRYKKNKVSVDISNNSEKKIEKSEEIEQYIKESLFSNIFFRQEEKIEIVFNFFVVSFEESKKENEEEGVPLGNKNLICSLVNFGQCCLIKEGFEVNDFITASVVGLSNNKIINFPSSKDKIEGIFLICFGNNSNEIVSIQQIGDFKDNFVNALKINISTCKILFNHFKTKFFNEIKNKSN